MIGVQGAGKSTFCLRRFAHSHLRLSRDLLGTANREMVLFHAALAVGARAVIDNTNPTRSARARFVGPARACGYEVIAYHVEASATDALARNAQREPARRVPDKAVLGTLAKLSPPTYDEGFSAIYRVRLGPDGAYDVALLPNSAEEHDG